MEDFKITLAAARVNAGMTQEDVAREMKVSKNTVVNWEKGRTEPSISQTRALARMYGLTVDAIKV